MASDVEKIKKLRIETGLGIHDIKKALEEAKGDEKKAVELLKKWGLNTVAKRAGRDANQGIIYTYTHANHRFGSMVEVNCETDFVARNDGFKQFVHDVALQVAAMNPESVEDLLKMEFFKEPSKTIGDLLTETIQKIGENIKIKRFVRYELGE